MAEFNIFARHEATGRKCNFLVESVDSLVAQCLFKMDYPTWVIERTRPAECFAGGDHRGTLSVCEGKDDRSVVLCRHHQENPPMS